MIVGSLMCTSDRLVESKQTSLIKPEDLKLLNPQTLNPKTPEGTLRTLIPKPYCLAVLHAVDVHVQNLANGPGWEGHNSYGQGTR